MSNLSTIFTNIADSIRNKAKITDTMLPSEMPYYINEIESSGGSPIKAIDGTTTQQEFFNIEAIEGTTVQRGFFNIETEVE